jgi:hypothetical protein
MPTEVPLNDFDGNTYGPTDGAAMHPSDRGTDGESYGDDYYGGGGSDYVGGTPTSGMPMGMPTSGFAPAAVPPQMIAGGPTWGMPITGTPIGLPGPPHVPLGSPAGLQRHVIRNRTRVVIPPPVTKMTMSVKQRPGLNYPRPVNRVTVDEVHREPGGIIPDFFGWLRNDDHQP